MKKIRKWISILTAAMLAAIPVLATPVTSLAKELEPEPHYWFRIDYETGRDVSTDIPITVTYNSSNPEFEYVSAEGMFFDGDEEISHWTEEEKKERAEMMERFRGLLVAEGYVWAGGSSEFVENDTVTLQLPFSGEYLIAAAISDDWEVIGHTSNSATFKCLAEESEDFRFIAIYRKGSASEDQFWFKPMKTQLNIAAEIAATTGKEATAEVSGDFGLSYEIMKWLEDHPNVTLKYTLTYKEKDYNIVIKGGQKLADPSIPWYGPEYLIGKFAK